MFYFGVEVLKWKWIVMYIFRLWPIIKRVRLRWTGYYVTHHTHQEWVSVWIFLFSLLAIWVLWGVPSFLKWMQSSTAKRNCSLNHLTTCCKIPKWRSQMFTVFNKLFQQLVPDHWSTIISLKKGFTCRYIFFMNHTSYSAYWTYRFWS